MSKLSNFHPKYGLELVRSIRKQFGMSFLLLNTVTFFSYVGAVTVMLMSIQLPYYREAGLDAKVMAEMAAISMIPWNCKGFVGIIADILPLFGRQKFWHFLFYIILGVIACIALAFTPFEVINKTPIIAGILFFFFSLSAASSDLLLEAKYIELMQASTNINANLLTYAWFCATLGQLFPSFIVGTVSDYADVRYNFLIILPLMVSPIPFLFAGGLIHDKVPKEESNKINFKRLLPQWQLVCITFLLVTASLGLIVITALVGPLWQLIYVIFAIIFLISITFMLMDKVIAKFALFQFFSTSAYTNIQSALEYYYTGEPDCAPNGPQFSYTITNSLAPLAFTITQFIALAIFQVVFYNWKFRSVLFLILSSIMISSVADIILVNGLNRYVYIPDVVVFILGYATFSQLFKVMSMITTSYLISKLCPKNVEATMYAFLAGFGHFGVSAASYIGVFLIQAFQIQTIPIPEKNIECDFSNLNWLIIVGHMIIPCVLLPTVLLAPDLRLNEKIKNEYVFRTPSTKKFNQIDPHFTEYTSTENESDQKNKSQVMYLD